MYLIEWFKKILMTLNTDKDWDIWSSHSSKQKCKMVQSVRKTGWQFLIKLNAHYHLPQQIPLPNIYLREIIFIHIKTCT